MAPSIGMPSSRRPEARGIHGWFLSATPLLVLGLAIFVVALNVRHYSTMCGSESARDEVLNKAAMERRIRTLENEIAQNGLLLKKVLSGLESRFDISSFTVEELRQLAQMEAEDIAQRRARLPPPPMSEYAKAKVSAAVEAGNMQDLVEGALSPVHRSMFDDFEPAEGQNEGWDWGPQSSSVYEDDFLGINKVESIQPPEFDVSDEEREKLCREWMSEHKVLPGVDWGTLRDEDQRKWKEYHCDEVVDPAAVNDLLTVFGEPLGKDAGGEFDGGYGYGKLYEEEQESGDEQEEGQGPRRPNDDVVHSDDEVASLPEDSRRAR